MSVVSNTGSITTPGLSSGLDINKVISGLMAAETRHLNNMQGDVSLVKEQISELGSLKSLLASLESNANSLSDLNANTAVIATSSDTKKLTAIASSSAVAGNYQIVISSLAKAQQLTSSQFNSNTDAAGINGTLRFTVNNNSFDVAITAGTNDNVNAIAAAINSASGNNSVAANVIATNDLISGDAKYQILLTAKNTGASGAISVTDVSGTASTVLNFAQTTAATNAQFTINGLNVVRSSNSFTDVISGVTLNLLSDDASTLNLSIGQNSAQTQSNISQALNNFITTYNTLMDSISLLNASDLRANSTIRTVKDQLRKVLSSVVENGGTFKTLAEIGVVTDTTFQQKSVDGREYTVTGKIKFKSDDFDKAATKDLASILKILTDATAGIGDKFADVADSLTNTTDGSVTIQIESFAKRQKWIERLISTENDRLATLENAYFAQFTALDKAIAQLQLSQQSLSQLFNGNSSSGSSSLGNFNNNMST